MNHDVSPAFYPSLSVSSIEDITRLEQTPLDEAITANSTYEIFVNSANAFGEKTALRFLKTAEPGGDSIAWSYNELLKRIHQTANMFHALGVLSTDVISILLPGCLEYHLALWGGEAAGIVNPLNPLQTEESLIKLMKASSSKVLVVFGEDADAGYWTKALNIMHAVPSLQSVLRVPAIDERQNAIKNKQYKDQGKAPDNSATGLPEGVVDFYQAMESQPDDRLVSGRTIAPDDVAAYFHTGGTTGSPKLARHTHGNQVFTAWASVQLQHVKHTDSTINGYPLFHVAGVLPGALTSLSAGVEMLIPTLSLMRNRDVVKNYWKLIEYHQTTVLSAVPTSLASLAAVPLDDADISSINMCRTGAAPLPPELGERFRRDFNIAVRESWGMTEMAGISSISPPAVDSPIGCVGFPLPFSRYKVVAINANGEPQARELPRGETGMLLAKSPNVFPGYLDESATQKVFTSDGWLITGDLGFIDSAGRINLNGRAKDLIIRSAHNIDPRVIEDVLDAHPAVDLCAAIGAPDAYAGELPVAYVTLKKGVNVASEELISFTAEKVEDVLARPKAVSVLNSMPMTNVGKIFKPELRRMASAFAATRKAEEILQSLSVDASVEVKASMDVHANISVRIQIASEKAVLDKLADEFKSFPVPVSINE